VRVLLRTRRWFVRALLSALGASTSAARFGEAASGELALPETVSVERFAFEREGVDRWTIVDGEWTVEEMSGAPSGRRVLVQRAVKNAFNVIVAPPGPYTDVDVSVRFKPIAGRQDASGGIVFRFSQGQYYVVRANALEDNFRLYFYDRGRRELASARVTPPAAGRWHTMRLVAVGDRMQAWLDGVLSLDHRDSRFKAGRVGLWTKADSVTAFDDLVIRGVQAGP
jgi:3-keto-disaccharide hydrolase